MTDQKAQMRRLSYSILERWKASKNRKPIVLKGARQVGKTYLLRSFGEQNYADVAYFNFEESPQIKEFFDGNILPEKIVEKLSIFREKKIEPTTTFIIFDEVQECGLALTSLKYFFEHAPQYHIAAAGSLLGVKLAQSPFPVGKVEVIDLYPFNFYEFLDAVGKTSLKKYLTEKKDWSPLEATFHEELLYQLKLYIFIGGMPEVISEYIRTKDLNVVRAIQNQLLKTYVLDFSKHAPRGEAIKITKVWQSLPSQLARENKKFKYSDVQKRARASQYDEAIQWLKDAGLILQCYCLNNIKLPLGGYKDSTKFKVYFFDTGLFGARLDISMKSILEKEDLFSQFFGVLAENFVAQQLSSKGREELYYWDIPQKAEVDFVYEEDGKIYPLEVKSGLVGNKSSLKQYREKFNPSYICIASPRNYSASKGFCNFPLYAIPSFPQFCELCIPEPLNGI